MASLRSVLMPPRLDEAQVERLSCLATEIVGRLDSGVDASPLIAVFCQESGTSVGPPDFQIAAGSQPMTEFVRSLLTPSPSRIVDISRDELVEVVSRIMRVSGSESTIQYWLELVMANVPHPAISDLIFWDELTAEQVVDVALAYKPLIPPPPA